MAVGAGLGIRSCGQVAVEGRGQSPGGACLGQVAAQRVAWVAFDGLGGCRYGRQRREQAGPGAESLVDGEAGNAGVSGDGTDAHRLRRLLGHEVAGRREDRLRRAVDELLPPAKAVLARHLRNLTCCLLN